jgi:hypothetical protein
MQQMIYALQWYFLNLITCCIFMVLIDAVANIDVLKDRYGEPERGGE